MKKLGVAAICLLLLSCAGKPMGGSRRLAEAEPSAQASAWGFALLSDMHIFPDSRIPEHLPGLIRKLAEKQPRLVLILGDSTNGNPGDRFGRKRADEWWKAVHEALRPLSDAGIPILPMPGNHDSYKPEHRAAYEAAWDGLWASLANRGLNLEGTPPLNYALDFQGVRFVCLNIVDQSAPDDTAAFARKAVREARLSPDPEKRAKRVFAFGHVPLASRMGRTRQKFEAEFGSLLVDAGADAYFAGHEHLVWDEVLSLPGGRSLRQVTTGTASATYTFPLRPDVVEKYCRDSRCRMPQTLEPFTLAAGTGQESRKQVFTWVEMKPDGSYTVIPFAYDARADQLVPFYEP